MKEPVIITLNNGIRVVHDYIESMESVSVDFWFNVGSRLESPDINGISHFLEHMAFKGTSSRTAKQISEDFDNMGASFNACTSQQYTSYYAHGLGEHALSMTDILSDILLNSTFPIDEIEKEKGVVLQEIAKTIDDPDDFIFDQHTLTCYPDQAMGRPILGSAENVKSFSQDLLHQYMNQYYRGKNVVISIAGKYNQDELQKFIESKFNSQNSLKEPNNIESATYSSGLFVEKRSLEQAHMIVGFPSFGDNNDIGNLQKTYTANIAAMILGGSASSRLFQSIREEKGLAYSVFSYYANYSDTGMLNMYAGFSPDKIEDILQSLGEELHKMSTEVSASELYRAKQHIKTSFLLKRENTASRASYNAKSIGRYNRYISSEYALNIIEKITLDDIQSFIKDIIRNIPNTAVAIIGNVPTLTKDTIIDIIKQN